MDSASKSASAQAIITKVDQFKDSNEKHWDTQNTQINEIIERLQRIEIKLAELEKGKATKKTTTKAPAKNKDVNNKIDYTSAPEYFGYMWRTDRDFLIKKLPIGASILKSLEEAKKTEKPFKDKVGPALTEAESGWLFTKQIKNNSTLNTALKKLFEEYKEENKKDSLTPASKETEDMD